MNEFGRNGYLARARKDYKTGVGGYDRWDRIGSVQFRLLTYLGLRESHRLLDIGCGSLRAGRFFIMYLNKSNYYGIEPNSWLWEDMIPNEVGKEFIRLRQPQLSNDSNFTCTLFEQTFDYINAHSVFTHATLEQVTRCISEAAKAMHDKSIFVATFHPGEEDNKLTSWKYNGEVKYRLDTLERLAKNVGLAFRYVPRISYHQKWMFLATEARLGEISRKLQLIPVYV